jgi:hypothetical protein
MFDSAGQRGAIVPKNRVRGQRVRGIILAIAPDGTDGQLTAEDGKSYS